MKNLAFLSIGSAVQDVFLSHSDAFTPVCESPEKCFEMLPLGAKVDVNNVDFATGGGATNAATTFARGGFHSIFMGTVGRDPAGEAVLRALDDEGVDTSRVSYSARYHTGYSVLLLAPTGERTILTYRGASTHYDAKNFDLTGLERVDWLYVSTMAGSFDALAGIFDQARAMNIKIAFNPGKRELADADKLRGLLDDVEILIANRDEMAQIVAGQSLEELVRHAQNYCPVVVVSDGPNGVAAADRHEIAIAGLYEDVPVKDRTGAGDAFGSGFVAKIASGANLREAITFASANSTSVIGQIGAKAGILTAGATIHEMPMEIKKI
jgi:ribokinase